MPRIPDLDKQIKALHKKIAAMSEQKQTVKVMPPKEWIATQSKAFADNAPMGECMQQYAEYFHAEKMKQGNDFIPDFVAIFQQGKDACNCKEPVSSNPYVGVKYNAETVWLLGYNEAEQMKQVGKDAEQAAEMAYFIPNGCVDSQQEQRRNDFIKGWQAKPSDAVAFSDWIWDNGYRQTNLKGIYSNSIGHYNVSELYSQFQKEKDK